MPNSLADHLQTLDLCRAALVEMGVDSIHADRLSEIVAALRERDELRAALRAATEEAAHAHDNHAVIVGALHMAGLAISLDGERQRYRYVWEPMPSLPAGPRGDDCRSYAAAVTDALVAIRRAK